MQSVVWRLHQRGKRHAQSSRSPRPREPAGRAPDRSHSTICRERAPPCGAVATTTVNIGFRPPRIATLVRAGSLDDLIEAAQASSHTWGGVFNPMVAVGTDSDVAIQEIREFQVDLVTVIGTPTAAQQAVLDATQHLEYRPMLRAPFEQGSNGGMPFADTRLICRHFHETTFRFGAPSNALYVRWSEDEPRRAFLSVLFGQFRYGPEGEPYRRAFVEGLAAGTVGPESVPSSLDTFTPISLTGSFLESLHGPRATGIVVGSIFSAEALRRFWNLRSVGCNVVFWPIDGLEEFGAFVRADVERLVGTPIDADGPYLDVWAGVGEQIDELPPDLEAMLASCSTTGVRSRFTDAIWTSAECRPAVWGTRKRAVLATVEKNRFGKQELVATLPPSPFAPAEPRPGDRQQWLVTVTTYRHFDLDELTFDVPMVPTLTPWASDELQAIGAVRLESDGLAIFAEVDATSISLMLVERRAVVARVLTEAGFSAVTSPAGEAANRIVAQMGGLQRCRWLRLPGLQKLLASGTHARNWRSAMSVLHDEGGYSRYRNVPAAPKLLRDVIARGALHPVLTIVCPQCNVRGDYRLSDVEAEMRCLRCNEWYELAPLLQETQWRYRPSGFFETLGSHGALAVVLTMMRLDEDLNGRSAFVEASYNLERDAWKAECDVVAVWRTRNGRPAMLVGECKGGEQRVEAGDIEVLTVVGDAVRELGIECYLTFATSRPCFSHEELAMFETLAEAHSAQTSIDEDWPGRRAGPLLLSCDQLNHHDFVPVTFDGMPVRYPFAMGALVANSRALACDAGLADAVLARRESDGHLV